VDFVLPVALLLFFAQQASFVMEVLLVFLELARLDFIVRSAPLAPIK
jgi:hypothetical protein